MGSFKKNTKETFLGLHEMVQEYWSDFLVFLKETWPILLFILLALMFAWWYADPPPPRHVVMATGAPGGSYEILGKKYAEFFAQQGVKLELKATKGAQENIALLVDRKDPVQAAFVQAGVYNPSGVEGIESLGSITYDPIWFFYRGPEVKDIHSQAMKALGELKKNVVISVGVEGGSSHAQAMQVLKASGLDRVPHFVYLPEEQGVQAIKKGEIDAIFIADTFEAPNVQALINDPELHLSNFSRAEAYARVLPYLTILNVPEGAFSLSRNFPNKDIKLLSTTTNLLIDDRMHPAIQFLFIEAAKSINGKATFFSKRGEFPAFKNSTLPESPVAVHFEKNGSPWLMNYLPFWLAEMINRLLFIMLPLFVFAYPALMALPSFRKKRMQNKLIRMYGTLKQYEQELTMDEGPIDRDAYLKKLDLLEYQVLNIELSKSMSSDYYALRTSIDYVRSCLNRGVHPYQTKAFNNPSV